MERALREVLYGIILLFISSALVSYFGVLRGVYVLSANLAVLLPWLCLMVLGSSGRAKEFQSRAVSLLSAMFFVSLLILGPGFERWDVVLDIVEVFAACMMFPVVVLIVKWRLSKRGKEIRYPAKTTKELWGFQWVANISIALKAPNPVRIFIFLLPAIMGGYMIYRAFTSVETE